MSLWVISTLISYGIQQMLVFYVVSSVITLTSVPFGATYHISTSDSTLDLCFVDIVIDHWITEVPYCADGHDLISVLNKSSITPPVPCNFTFRNFKSADTVSICDHLTECDWSVFKSNSFLEIRVSCLCTHLDEAITRFFSIKTIHHNGKRRWKMTCNSLRMPVTQRTKLPRKPSFCFIMRG